MRTLSCCFITLFGLCKSTAIVQQSESAGSRTESTPASRSDSRPTSKPFFLESESLRKARNEYHVEIEQVSAAIMERFQGLEKAARDSGSLTEAKSIKEEREKFVDTGACSRACSDTSVRDKWTKARKKLLDVLSDAVQIASKTSQDELCSALKSDVDYTQRTNDLAPYKDVKPELEFIKEELVWMWTNGKECINSPQKPLKDGQYSVLSLGKPTGKAYQIELNVQSTGGKGSLVLGLTNGKEQPIEVNIDFSTDTASSESKPATSATKIVAVVQQRRIAMDVNGKRFIYDPEFQSLPTGRAKDLKQLPALYLSVVGEAPKFQIQTIRIKPLLDVERLPEDIVASNDTEQKPKKPEPKPEKPKPEPKLERKEPVSALAVGSRWTGTRTAGQKEFPCSAEVVARTDDILILRVKEDGGNLIMRWEFKVVGNSLKYKLIDPEKKTGNHSKKSFSNGSSAGNFNAKEIRVTYGWNVKLPKDEHPNPVQGVLTLHPD